MKKIQSILAALCVAAIVSGCGKSEAPKADSGSAPAAGKKLKLAFVSNNAATFWTRRPRNLAMWMWISSSRPPAAPPSSNRSSTI
jgi:hypothetical protein